MPADPDHAADPLAFSETARGPDRRVNVLDVRGTGLERRRGPGRRRSDFAKAAEEGEMTPEQFLMVKAIDAFKRVNDRPFPSWCEVLEVMRKLGYRKTMPSELTIKGAQDWSEAPDAAAFGFSDAEEETEADLEAA
ncbi:hypothetical protein [Phycisphaera mikurensis]|uniref:Uncharacterized protein n=1 Tax=Phycisphaera mikurensis (strain NBRC 102666 / KCTC 22515 / FYK2301M01) TaxID=1142394 RepID=I0IIM9_PHYMF|nr:hypothetical protein [Phycisphaera mikurensis]MBB6442731.1 hypothetical protein [Phycisphaera mikurensis]BAM05117.1 hypothetical protein PSMK_29580 [Phycisphaera mikurensis NBRC 102666]